MEHTTRDLTDGAGGPAAAIPDSPHFSLGEGAGGAAGQGRRKTRGLPRMLADTEALLQRKKDEYAAALAERKRLLSRLHIMEVVLPQLEDGITRMAVGGPLHSRQTAAAAAAQLAGASAVSMGAGQQAAGTSAEGAASSGGAMQDARVAGLLSSPLQDAGGSPFPLLDDALFNAMSPCSPGHSPLPANLFDEVDGMEALAGMDSIMLELLGMLPATPSTAEGSAAPGQTSLEHVPSSDPSGSGASLAQGGEQGTAGSGGPGAAPAGAGSSATQWLRGATPQQVQVAMAAEWRSYVQDAAFLLGRLALRPEEEHAQLEQALKDRWIRADTFAREMVVRHRNAWFSMYGLNLDTGMREEPPPGHWRAVARAAKLQPEQVAQAREVMALYDERMKEVTEERRRLTAELSHALEASAAQQPGLDTGASVHDVLKQLAQNVEHQRMTTMTTVMFVTNTPTFEPSLNARVSLAAWPYVPDSVATLQAVLELADEEQAARQRGNRADAL